MKSVLAVLVVLATTWLPPGAADPCIDPTVPPSISTQGECSFLSPQAHVTTDTYTYGNATYLSATVTVTDGRVTVQVTIVCIIEHDLGGVAPLPIPQDVCAVYVSPPGLPPVMPPQNPLGPVLP